MARIEWSRIKLDLHEKSKGSLFEVEQVVDRLHRNYDAILRIARKVHSEHGWQFPTWPGLCAVANYSGVCLMTIHPAKWAIVSPSTLHDSVAFCGGELTAREVFSLPTIKGYANPIAREVSHDAYEYYYRRVV